jgi:hypothetical protein
LNRRSGQSASSQGPIGCLLLVFSFARLHRSRRRTWISRFRMCAAAAHPASDI